MFLTGKEIRSLVLRKKLVEDYVDLDTQIQPNGVDLTIRNVELLESTPGVIDFTGEKRTFPQRKALSWSRDDIVELSPGNFYLGWTNEMVNMPSNMVGILKPRTSAFTMGLAISTGVVDAGFRGHIRFGLSASVPVKVIKNARLIHMVVARLSGRTKEYEGIWKEKG